MLMYSFLFVVCIAFQELIPLNYNKEIMSSIIVRAYHSIGCIYYLTPILLKTEHALMEVESTEMPSDVNFVLKRSAYFFLWDTEETLAFKPIPKSFESEIFFACNGLTSNKLKNKIPKSFFI